MGLGVLGEKLLQAGIVQQEDAERLHRQEVIERENARKQEQQRKAQERKRLQQETSDAPLRQLATLLAAIEAQFAVLEPFGFTREDCASIQAPSLDLLLRLSRLPSAVQAFLMSAPFRDAIAEQRDLLLTNEEFCHKARIDLARSKLKIQGGVLCPRE